MKFYRLLHSSPDPYGDDERARRRGENPPTWLDGLFKFGAAFFHGCCALVCFIGSALYAMDATSTGKSLSIVVFGTLGGGFTTFAVLAFRRGVQIFRGTQPAARGFELESDRDEY